MIALSPKCIIRNNNRLAESLFIDSDMSSMFIVVLIISCLLLLIFFHCSSDVFVFIHYLFSVGIAGMLGIVSPYT